MLDNTLDQRSIVYEIERNNIRCWIQQDLGDYINCYTILVYNLKNNRSHMCLLFSEEHCLSAAWDIASQIIEEM